MGSDNQYTALGPATVGFQTNSNSIDHGAEIVGNTVGVHGSCDAGTGVSGNSISSTGVSGESVSGFGVSGISNPQSVIGGAFPSGDIGVYGNEGSTQKPFGVETKGTGVLGLGSVRGVYGGGALGVVGESDGGVGVTGIASATAATMPLQDEGFSVGVFGAGDHYGGVFKPTPSDSTYANVQLTPVKAAGTRGPLSPFKSQSVLPYLPPNGKQGDILSVVTDSDSQGVKLWVCIKGAAPPRTGATWARLNYDAMVVMPWIV